MNLEEVQQIDTLKGALEIPPETPSAIFSFWLLLTALPSWGIKTTDLDLSHISRTLSGTHHTLNGFSDLHSFFFRQIYSEIIPIVGEKHPRIASGMQPTLVYGSTSITNYSKYVMTTEIRGVIPQAFTG